MFIPQPVFVEQLIHRGQIILPWAPIFSQQQQQDVVQTNPLKVTRTARSDKSNKKFSYEPLGNKQQEQLGPAAWQESNLCQLKELTLLKTF